MSNAKDSDAIRQSMTGATPESGESPDIRVLLATETENTKKLVDGMTAKLKEKLPGMNNFYQRVTGALLNIYEKTEPYTSYPSDISDETIIYPLTWYYASDEYKECVEKECGVLADIDRLKRENFINDDYNPVDHFCNLIGYACRDITGAHLNSNGRGIEENYAVGFGVRYRALYLLIGEVLLGEDALGNGCEFDISEEDLARLEEAKSYLEDAKFR